METKRQLAARLGVTTRTIENYIVQGLVKVVDHHSVTGKVGRPELVLEATPEVEGIAEIKKKIMLGIDPGASGGIAWFSEDGKLEGAFHMPETEADTVDLLRLATVGKKAFALIEKVHSMPGQGVASTFAFGKNYGFIRGVLVALGIPFDEVQPKKWQGVLGLSGSVKECGKTEWKNKLKGKAQQLYPEEKLTLKTCDAVLIAHYLVHHYGK